MCLTNTAIDDGPSTSTSSLAHNLTDPSHLLPPTFKAQITSWLAEDTPSFDPAGYVVGEQPRRATLWAKSSGVLAGTPFFDEVFAQLGCAVTWHVSEGAQLAVSSSSAAAASESSPSSPSASSSKISCATITGPARAILLGERLALNILARCSGIATSSARMVRLVRQAGYTGLLAGTRKTTPGFRLVEKYGMLVGGADPHRMDLSSMVMLKDNHVWSKGSITHAVRAARAVAGFSLKIEVEVQTEQEADEAIAAGADLVMLDNFTAEGVSIAAASLKERWAGQRQFLLEVSGGLTVENVATYVCN
ncbi:hypothetical protein E4U54_000912, partial [Claviceps lovelessii]